MYESSCTLRRHISARVMAITAPRPIKKAYCFNVLPMTRILHGRQPTVLQ